MTVRKILLPVLGLLFGPILAAWGQTEASNVNRADFAAAYIRFERALLTNSLNDTGMVNDTAEASARAEESLLKVLSIEPENAVAAELLETVRQH